VTDEQDGESFLFAVDRTSGLVRWKIPRESKPEQNTSYATPCLLPKRGANELIVASWAHGISSLDPRTGTTNWQAKVLPRRPGGPPIVVDGIILANWGEGSGNNNVVALRPPTAKDAEPEVLYTIDKTSAPYVPTLVARDNLVFLWGDRGIVACMDVHSGEI